MSDKHQAVDVQYAVTVDGMPEANEIRQWVLQALPEQKKASELTVRVVDEAEITALNRQYRGKEGATNVLSFPYEAIPGVASDLLGDVVICAPVVASESVAQNKPLDAHWAHMVIHGVLHLLGYGHHQDDEAHKMEVRETELLDSLGYTNPY
ncbi:MAG: rRNA maturation RNase YbeY [Gammaproteobacteria bacterium]|nr:MAG: rRNA maturation RNase YbeY [Gammaproteobacteria bacterium]